MKRSVKLSTRSKEYQDSQKPCSDDEDDKDDRKGSKTALDSARFMPENCTVCFEQINTANSHHCKSHPVLRVLMCRGCYKYCVSGEISRDSNGQDEQCTWCCEGGQLICCDFCRKAFCKSCIRRNIGRSELRRVLGLGEGDKWKCYGCEPSAISSLVDRCTEVFDNLKKIESKQNSVKQTPSKSSCRPSFDINHVSFGSRLTHDNLMESFIDIREKSKSFLGILKELEKEYRSVDTQRQACVDELLVRVKTSIKTHLVSLINSIGYKNVDRDVEASGLDEDIKVHVGTDRKCRVTEVIEIPDELDEHKSKADRKVTETAEKVNASGDNDLVKGDVASDQLNIECNDYKTTTENEENLIGASQISADRPIALTTKGKVKATDSVCTSKESRDCTEVKSSRCEDNNKDDDGYNAGKDTNLNIHDKYLSFPRIGRCSVVCEKIKVPLSDNLEVKTTDRVINSSDGCVKNLPRERLKRSIVEKVNKFMKNGSNNQCSVKRNMKYKNSGDISDETDENKLAQRDLDADFEDTFDDDVNDNEITDDKNKSIVGKSVSDEEHGGAHCTLTEESLSLRRESEGEAIFETLHAHRDYSPVNNLDQKEQIQEPSDKKKLVVKKEITPKKCKKEVRGHGLDSESDSDDLFEVDVIKTKRKKFIGAKTGVIEKTGVKPVGRADGNSVGSDNDHESSGHDSDLEKSIKNLSAPVKLTKGDNKGTIKKRENKIKKENASKKENTSKKENEEDSSENSQDEADDDNPDESQDSHITSDCDPVQVTNEDDFNSLDANVSQPDKEHDENSSSEEDISPIPNKKQKSPKKINKTEDKTDEAPTDESDNSEDDELCINRPKKNLHLLNAKISSDNTSDEESDEQTKMGKKPKKSSKVKKTAKQSSPVGSDDDSVVGKKRKKRKRIKSNDESVDSWSGLGTTDEDEDQTPKKKRRRIKAQDSSASDGENPEGGDKESPEKSQRRDIRKVMTSKKLAEESKAAAKAEVERRKRVEELQKKFNVIEEVGDRPEIKVTTKLVLESDKDNEPLVSVHPKLIRKLKPHQVEAVQFMWTSTIETLERREKEKGSGCILAHCMGLGKTLSVITFIHTVLTNDNLKMNTCLIVAPLNTVLNWVNEWEKWLDHDDRLDVYETSSVKTNPDRLHMMKQWQRSGGILIMGYEMFRMLSTGARLKKKKMKEDFIKCLLDPGPDIVVCDEGHILKNDGSGVSKAMNCLKTKRRIVLTGTPLQNNLVEYHCMVNFVKENLLGTRKEFSNRFVNPITNGQCLDSTQFDVKLMKRRAHILHDLLSGCVQRRDYSALTKFLPPKFEYIISVRLSKTQIDLYERYLSSVVDTNQSNGTKGTRLFADYQVLSRIWTHPWVLKMDEIRKINSGFYDKTDDEDSDSFIDDSDECESDVSSHSSSGDTSQKSSKSVVHHRRRNTRSMKKAKDDDVEIIGEGNIATLGGDKGECSKAGENITGSLEADAVASGASEENTACGSVSVMQGWWDAYLKEEDKFREELSGKISLLFAVLKMCEEIGDKVLVFSQSILSLDLIEQFLEHADSQYRAECDQKADGEKTEEFGKKWVSGLDYFRMDGSTPVNIRSKWASQFNEEDNHRARLFLISTKAGSLGINLVASNRVIMFDASWNPSHDIQSIFRVYRFGQTKPVYVYRFLAQGTMEEKIYERQVTKQSLSQRVVDEHQIERHFTAADLQELYNFKPERLDDPATKNKPTPILPKDHLLAELLQTYPDWLVGYHEHDSLLENKVDQELDEEERKAAWEDYENEKTGIRSAINESLGNSNISPYLYGYDGRSMLMRHPTGLPNTMNYRATQRLITPNTFNVSQLINQLRFQNPNISADVMQSIITNAYKNHMATRFKMQQQQLENQLLMERQRQLSIRQNINQQERKLKQTMLKK